MYDYDCGGYNGIRARVRGYEGTRALRARGYVGSEGTMMLYFVYVCIHVCIFIYACMGGWVGG